MNERINLDRRLSRKRYGKKSIPTDIVRDTWHGTIQDEMDLPKNWAKDLGVLVGIVGC